MGKWAQKDARHQLAPWAVFGRTCTERNAFRKFRPRSQGEGPAGWNPGPTRDYCQGVVITGVFDRFRAGRGPRAALPARSPSCRKGGLVSCSCPGGRRFRSCRCPGGRRLRSRYVRRFSGFFDAAGRAGHGLSGRVEAGRVIIPCHRSVHTADRSVGARPPSLYDGPPAPKDYGIHTSASGLAIR